MIEVKKQNCLAQGENRRHGNDSMYNLLITKRISSLIDFNVAHYSKFGREHSNH